MSAIVEVYCMEIYVLFKTVTLSDVLHCRVVDDNMYYITDIFVAYTF